MLVLHCQWTKLHMARNIFSICELTFQLKLSILFVGKVKITPFNGSIFFNGSRPFLCGINCRWSAEGTTYLVQVPGTVLPIWFCRTSLERTRNWKVPVLQYRTSTVPPTPSDTVGLYQLWRRKELASMTRSGTRQAHMRQISLCWKAALRAHEISWSCGPQICVGFVMHCQPGCDS
jgi:hypothetical protein